MGCEFCNHQKTMMSMSVATPTTLNFHSLNPSASMDDVLIKLGVFIDRGHIRLVDLDDANCIESGQKIPIKFCPFCGKEMKKRLTQS